MGQPEPTALAKYELFDFDESIQVAGVNLLRKYLKHFVLTDKLNTENWVKGFRHHNPRFRVA